MEKVKEELYNAIEWFGKNDVVTIMISQKLDKLIVNEMRCKYGKTVC